jgi:zinc finger protein
MAAESEKQNFFEPIGNKAQGLSANTNGDSTEEEFKPVDEIESLCMNCHENVSRFALRLKRGILSCYRS